MGTSLAQLALLFVIMVASARAADTLVLIDRSGSMKLHYQSGRAQNLAARILQACSKTDEPQLAVFDIETVLIPNLQSPDLATRGKDTYLSKVLGEAKESYRRIWLLTDNVQDVGGSEDMTEFYRTLQSSRIQTVYVFPLRQEPGASGLLLYAISTEQDAARLDAQIAEFHKDNGDLKVSELVMKPLGENAIQVQIEGGSKSARFEAGSEFNLESQIHIRAKYPHLFFASSPAEGGHIRSPFSRDSCLVTTKSDSDIDPKQVQTATEGVYKVNLDFGKVRLNNSLRCFWHAGFERSHDTREIDTPIIIRVPRQSLRLSSQFLKDFAASSEAEARQTGKIYGLEHLPEFLAPEMTEIPIHIPRQVTIQYPSWPALLLLFGGGVLLAGAGLGIRSLGALLGQVRITAQTEEGEKLPVKVHRGEVYVQDKPFGKLNRNKFSPANGIRLEPDMKEALFAGSLTCITADGRRIQLIRGTGPDRKTPGAGSKAGVQRSMPSKRSTVRLTKR